MATVYYNLLLISSCLLRWSSENVITPVVYTDKEPPFSQCGQSDPLVDIKEELMETLNMIHQQLPSPGCNPPLTCKDVIRCNATSSSGYYQIQAANGSAVQVYCDMEGTNCGGESDWMRVANLDATSPSNPCPAGLQAQTHNGNKFCRDSISSGCRPILIETFGHAYSQAVWKSTWIFLRSSCWLCP